MTELQAVYRVNAQEVELINDIAPELLKAIRNILTSGYGEVVIQIADKKIVKILKTESIVPEAKR